MAGLGGLTFNIIDEEDDADMTCGQNPDPGPVSKVKVPEQGSFSIFAIARSRAPSITPQTAPVMSSEVAPQPPSDPVQLMTGCPGLPPPVLPEPVEEEAGFSLFSGHLPL